MAETHELAGSEAGQATEAIDATETQAIGTLPPGTESELAANPDTPPSPAPSAPPAPSALNVPPAPFTRPTRPVRSAARARRPRRWLHWRLGVTIASVIAIALTAILLAQPVPPAQPNRPKVVLIVPRGDGVECARDAEWAPEGTRLVVLGYAHGCPDASSGAASRTGSALIYDAVTGSLVSRIQPDLPIARAAGVPRGGVIEYAGALWSPDGKRLAISFGISSGGPAVEGVYLCNADGSHARVLLRASGPASGDTGIWDLQSGAYVPAPPLTPALGYQWISSGVLAPTKPLTSETTPPAATPGAIGVPDGGTTFSAWQPAAITLRAPGDPSQPATDGAYVLSSSFAVWSPDGRYLIPSAGLQARLPSADAPAPSQATLAALGLANTPMLPVRDRALQIALDRLGALTPDERGNSPMLVAWSPEGRLLAVQLVPAEPNDVPHITHHALLIYDCATGKALIALTPDATNTPTEGPTFVRWSPNGARLMLFDNQMGTLTIFGRGKIPAS